MIALGKPERFREESNFRPSVQEMPRDVARGGHPLTPESKTHETAATGSWLEARHRRAGFFGGFS